MVGIISNFIVARLGSSVCPFFMLHETQSAQEFAKSIDQCLVYFLVDLDSG